MYTLHTLQDRALDVSLHFQNDVYQFTIVTRLVMHLLYATLVVVPSTLYPMKLPSSSPHSSSKSLYPAKVGWHRLTIRPVDRLMISQVAWLARLALINDLKVQ